MTMVAVERPGRLAIVSVTWLPALVSVKAGPAFCDWLTKNSRAGSRSDRVTFRAGSPPLLRTVMVYWMLLPAITVGGPAFCTDTLAGVNAVVITVELLFAAFVSNVGEVTVA